MTAAAVPKAGPGVAAVAGAAHGVQALPSALVGRLEIREEVDRLAVDLAGAVGLTPLQTDLYAFYPSI